MKKQFSCAIVFLFVYKYIFFTQHRNVASKCLDKSQIKISDVTLNSLKFVE